MFFWLLKLFIQRITFLANATLEFEKYVAISFIYFPPIFPLLEWMSKLDASGPFLEGGQSKKAVTHSTSLQS